MSTFYWFGTPTQWADSVAQDYLVKSGVAGSLRTTLWRERHLGEPCMQESWCQEGGAFVEHTVVVEVSYAPGAGDVWGQMTLQTTEDIPISACTVLEGA